MSEHQKSKDAIRIKVIQHSNGGIDSQCCKFSIAPELTSYDVLRNLISRAFDIKGEYETSYLTRDDRFPEACWVPLLTDFDLELAFHRSSDPYLLVKVELVSSSNGVFSSSNIDLLKLSLPVISKANYSSRLPGLFKDKMEKTLSVMQKAFNWTEEEEEATFSPLTDTDFQKMMDPTGALKDTRELRLRVYMGGIEPSLRKVVWKHILNVYPNDLTGRERLDYMKKLATEYQSLKSIWKDHLKKCPKVSEELKYTTNMVRKDVLRTDRTHPFFSGSDDNANITALYNVLTTYALNHPSIGYCQGMSDIASPILAIMKDEAHTYVCLCALMNRVKPNFSIDGDAMTLKFQHLTEALLFYDPEFFSYLQQHQAEDLLFCYRWLLLELKREFAFEDAQLMLEILWSSIPPNPPEKILPLTEEPFNPEKHTLPDTPPLVRQNHFANVCALRRERLSVSSERAEIVANMLRRRATSEDISASLKGLPKDAFRRSHTLASESHHCGATPDASDSSSESPSKCSKKVRDLSEFQRLISSSKREQDSIFEDSENKNEKNSSLEKVDSESAVKRNCFSESDANDYHKIHENTGCETSNPSDSSSKEKRCIADAIEGREISLVACDNKKLPSNESSPKRLSADRNTDDIGWRISISGDPIPCLPPPNELGGGNPLLIFLCVTLLTQQRQHVMQQQMDHNELAMHFDKMVRSHNVRKVLSQARRTFESYLRSDFSSRSQTIDSSPASSFNSFSHQNC